MTSLTNSRGSAVVEFALVLPLVLIALGAAVELTIVARTQMELVNAAREGARTAATVVDPAEAAAATRRALGSVGSTARVSVTRPHVVGEEAVVTIMVPHRIAGAIFGGFEVPLRARSVMRVEL
ncbi:MAG: pilus assembly protein [Acidimicrobiia bacterium]|nr:pilus assembly protein [Acidimicrobiia bacterium]